MNISRCACSVKMLTVSLYIVLYIQVRVCMSRRTANGAVICNACAKCTMSFCWSCAICTSIVQTGNVMDTSLLGAYHVFTWNVSISDYFRNRLLLMVC